MAAKTTVSKADLKTDTTELAHAQFTSLWTPSFKRTYSNPQARELASDLEIHRSLDVGPLSATAKREHAAEEKRLLKVLETSKKEYPDIECIAVKVTADKRQQIDEAWMKAYQGYARALQAKEEAQSMSQVVVRGILEVAMLQGAHTLTRETARFCEGNWLLSLQIAAQEWHATGQSFDESAVLRNATALARGVDDRQIQPPEDPEISFEREEELAFAIEGLEGDPDAILKQQQARQEKLVEKRDAILQERRSEAAKIREKIIAHDDATLLDLFCNYHRQATAEGMASVDRQVYRVFHTVRDPNRTVEVTGKPRFGMRIHPTLFDAVDEVRHIYQNAEDFWGFLVELCDDLELIKSQSDVERVASSRPFRGSYESVSRSGVVDAAVAPLLRLALGGNPVGLGELS